MNINIMPKASNSFSHPNNFSYIATSSTMKNKGGRGGKYDIACTP